MDKNQEEQLFVAFENEPKFEYVRFIAGQHLLDYDEDGEPCGWSVSFDLFRDLQTELDDNYPIARSVYDECEEIQGSIAAIGLNPDMLWEAVRYIRYMSETKCVDAFPVLPSLAQQVELLLDALHEKGTTIKINRPTFRSFTLPSDVHSYLEDLVAKDYSRRIKKNDPFFSGRSILLNEQHTLGTQRQMGYEAALYLEIFENYSTDKEMPRRSKGQGPSRDKLWLASRLMYLTGLTTNLSYWNGKDALKAVMRKCQNGSEVDTCSSKHLF